MAAQPFVWQIEIPRDVLDSELDELHNLPYSVWRSLVATSWTKDVIGRDERTYRITIGVEPVAPDTEDLRVVVSLRRARRALRRALRASFVITPDSIVLRS